MRPVLVVSVLAVACVSAALAADYDGPRPPKPDLVYLQHASNLIPTEATEAKQENRKDDVVYTIAGAASPAKTPLPEPIFLVEANKLKPQTLELYRLEVRNGNREITISHKKKLMARPLHMNYTKLSERIWKLEADESLEPGQYSLSPSDSNDVFCFEVY